MASTRRRLWWLTPFAWWALAQGLIWGLTGEGHQLANQPVHATDAQVLAAFESLVHTIWICTGIIVLGAAGWLALLLKLRREDPPVWGRSFVILAAVLALAASLVLAQGAWRCHAPPPPYIAAEPLRFFFYIAVRILQACQMLWGMVGVVVVIAAPIDWVRCLRQAAAKFAR